ncbi:hypothetical protein PAPYR_479 [Paratrimastix pyriformis]|uniref:Uncharacterized protein n=1 Tax=Paratrimastix pyriformis TaxID=342808 RepID=A0ABQ8UTP5_9EUKA|nr:hypothetical protein PAPYR_479 [Paratrimastix pyriformis]
MEPFIVVNARRSGARRYSYSARRSSYSARRSRGSLSVGSATLLPLLGEAENIEITEDLRTVGQLRALHRGRPIFLRDPVTRRRIHVQDSALLRPERIYFEDAPFEIHTFRVECAGIINYSAKQHGGDFSLRETVTHAANTAAVPFLGEIRHEPSPIEHACQDYYLVSVAIPCDDPGRLDQFMALVQGACSACDLSKCKHTTRPGTPDEYVTFSFPDHDFSRHNTKTIRFLSPTKTRRRTALVSHRRTLNYQHTSEPFTLYTFVVDARPYLPRQRQGGSLRCALRIIATEQNFRGSISHPPEQYWVRVAIPDARREEQLAAFRQIFRAAAGFALPPSPFSTEPFPSCGGMLPPSIFSYLPPARGEARFLLGRQAADDEARSSGASPSRQSHSQRDAPSRHSNRL